LGASLGLLSVGAHFGGTITHGDTYLTKYAPGVLKSLLGATPEPGAASSAKPARRAPSSEPLLFADVVQPILRHYCVDCHGPAKTKGKLRLDSLESMIKGGEDGAALVSGSAEQSPLVKRMLLPQDDDDRMPPEGKPGPKPEEIAVIKFWIDRGASAGLRVRDALPPASARTVLERALQNAPSASAPAPAQSAAPSSSAPRDDGPVRTPPRPGGSKRPADAASAPAQDRALEPEAPSKPEVSAGAEKPTANAPGILAEKCQPCHGPAKQKGKLRVDSLDALLHGGKSGPALVPGNPNKSAIIVRTRLPLTDDDHMPPKNKPQLSAQELSVLSAWVQHDVRAPTRSSSPSPAAQTTGTALNAGATAETPGVAESSPEPKASTAQAAAAEPAKNASEPASYPVAPGVPAEVALYHDAVQPLLQEKCGRCHSGPKAKSQLDVTDYQLLMAGGKGGPALVAGNVQGSELIRRVTLPASDDEHMPPQGAPPLSEGDIELLRTWVALGASADRVVRASELPPAAQRAVADGVSERNAENKAAVHGGGGCAACAVGGVRSGARDALGLSFFALATALLALRVRRRITSNRPSRATWRRQVPRKLHVD
jgi:hypothetical protein